MREMIVSHYANEFAKDARFHNFANSIKALANKAATRDKEIKVEGGFYLNGLGILVIHSALAATGMAYIASNLANFSTFNSSKATKLNDPKTDEPIFDITYAQNARHAEATKKLIFRRESTDLEYLNAQDEKLVDEEQKLFLVANYDQAQGKLSFSIPEYKTYLVEKVATSEVPITDTLTQNYYTFKGISPYKLDKDASSDYDDAYYSHVSNYDYSTSILPDFQTVVAFENC